MSVSVIIPCLDEEDSIEASVSEARKAFEDESELEVLVVDNGSKDRSRALALRAGAEVIEERRRGYGSAILRGLNQAKGDYLIMGDADLTYDFHDARRMVNLLKEQSADFAIGDRLNGDLEKGAMPYLHRILGTPILSFVMRLFFGTRVKDINCGLRAFKRECLKKMRLQSTGMEFASEMVIHAKKAGLSFVETPIRYRRRGGGEAKLRTVRDGWRHLRFILLCAPFPVFWLPAMLFLVAGGFCFMEPRFGYQVLGSLFVVLASQLLFFGIAAKAFLWLSDDFLLDRKTGQIIAKFKLEYGIFVSFLFGLAGLIVMLQFDLANLIRGATVFSFAIQIFFSSFLISMMLAKIRPVRD